MESKTSGHRRRRSSLINPLSIPATDTESSSRGTVRTPQRGRRGGPKSPRKKSRSRSPDAIQEEGGASKADILDGSDEDSKSASEQLEMDDLSEEDEGLQDDEETGLTRRDRDKRKRQKRRNTLLDQRVVPGGEVRITAEEKKEADQSVIKRSLINVGFIGLWYLFSLSISLYNKWMFDPKHLDFHFPLFTTCLHMLVQFTLASLVLFFFPQFRPSAEVPSNSHNRHELDEAEKRPFMTKMFYITRIGPCGMATGLDIGLGNMSLKFITLTFYTMCKSSSLTFVLLFAFLFRLETPSWRLVLIIATMTLGVIMMVFGEVSFSPLGFTLVITAALFSGFRWSLTQILLLRNPATSNPFSSIFFLAPVMFLSLLIIALPVEGLPGLIEGLRLLMQDRGPVVGPMILIFPGAIAFCMTASEFALLQRTSVVTLSIAGIFKEVVTISAAGLVFHDRLTLINILGLVTTMAAIITYNYIKIRKMRSDTQLTVHLMHERQDEIERSREHLNDDDEDDDEDEDGEDAPLVTSDGDILPNHGRTGESSHMGAVGTQANGAKLSND
ncbi:triose-phosphate transporter family-domain-containing protein [Xylogone sp. PMI_703]|nr:triose-phosphate transporter family-domain-containing protein [Xylogone sp. PMI_703]